MSTQMDTQDLRGFFRGVCLVAIVRSLGPDVTPATVRRWFGTERQRIDDFAESLSTYSGADRTSLIAAVDELLDADDEFLRLPNLELWLGLLAGRPLPEFPSLRSGTVDRVALVRPLLDSSRNMLHAAIRLRMQTSVTSPAGEFWSAAQTFLGGLWGDALGRALATSAISDAISDVLFHNWDTPTRLASEPEAERVRTVLGELRATDLVVLAG